MTGDVVSIKWGQGESGRLYKAKILDRCPTDDGDWTYLIHYVGWTDAYDDWIFATDIEYGRITSVVFLMQGPAIVEFLHSY